MKRKAAPPKPGESSPAGNVSQAGSHRLTSFNVGALPILDHFIRRARIDESLRKYTKQDRRCSVSPVTGILVVLKNYLVSREPVYGVGEWARQCVPGLLGLSSGQISSLNDDRVGRCLDRLFEADCSQLVLDVTRRVSEEFDLDLSEIHNDSTTVTVFGKYDGAREEGKKNGKKTPAITWGENKDHRPDLKQILYNLTVTADGTVPIVFGVENGNVTDDQTHRATWDLVCKIVGNSDFLYVADSKLATRENMSYIVNRAGRFLSVLPRTRAEDKEFRKKVLQGGVEWVSVHRKYDDQGALIDEISAVKGPFTTAEGYRLLWFYSTRKAELDRLRRSNEIRRAEADLGVLRLKLASPRTRYRDEAKVAKAVAKILAKRKATEWVHVDIISGEQAVFVAEKPGRPGPNTRYRKKLRTRFDIIYTHNSRAIEEAEKLDGIFPLVTNDRELSEKAALEVYKRQPFLEKRFSQFKSQFEVAPVFLKSVHRIVALLSVYYFTLVVQALVERSLRLAMEEEGRENLPLYPEGRRCKAPTTRRVIDFFENIQYHELAVPGQRTPIRFITELSVPQREVLRLLGISESCYKV